VARVLFIIALAVCASCETPPPTCTTTPLDEQCQPLYTPDTFAKVYSFTIQPDCGSSKGSCHGANGEAELAFDDPQKAYEGLVKRVKAGDPTCSELIVRTHDTGQDYSMPPDSPLGESERCALLKWVEMGTPQ
jgi:hypothetical protein